MREIVVGIDTGGTFTDVVRVDAREASRARRDDAPPRRCKVPSTPEDPARALLHGLREILDDVIREGAAARIRVVHGTTVATNALLERRLARTALVTNRGMEDLIEIGRQARPDLYALHPVKPAPIVPRGLRFGIGARAAADGSEVSRESEAEMEALVAALRAARVEAIAVCLLHSTADGGATERRIAARLEGLAVPVVCAGELTAEPREVERFETAIANAALAPLMAGYLERIAAGAAEVIPGATCSVLVMRSDGGLLPARTIAREPVRTLLSGPAGGVLGARRAASRAGIGGYVAIDVGGTSSDVSLSGASVRAAGEVGGVRVAVVAQDVVSVALGGGSVAWLDAGGALRVGPRSAGARPGPACYGSGDEPTVTDAALVLGRLHERFFLGGTLRIYPERARESVERLASRCGLSPERAAEGILEVGATVAERALRAVSVERGIDPRDRALVAFGGAGGLFAAPLAERLGMRRALVPADPGVLSAAGMADAPILFDRSAALLAPLGRLERDGALARAFGGLSDQVAAAFAAEGEASGSFALAREIDARYTGQSHEIRIEYRGAETAAAFHAAHLARNGFADDAREVEVVAAHVTGRSTARSTAGPPLDERAVRPVLARPAHGTCALERSAAGPLRDLSTIEAGDVVEGPSVIGDYSGTTWVPPAWRAVRLDGGALLLESAEAAE